MKKSKTTKTNKTNKTTRKTKKRANANKLMAGILSVALIITSLTFVLAFNILGDDTYVINESKDIENEDVFVSSIEKLQENKKQAIERTEETVTEEQAIVETTSEEKAIEETITEEQVVEETTSEEQVVEETTSEEKVSGNIVVAKEETLPSVIVEKVTTGKSVEEVASALANQISATDGCSVATKEEVMQYIDPIERYKNDKMIFQFLTLDVYRPVDITKVEEYLSDKGVFAGQASTFIDAAKENNIDVLYLIGHAMLETGKGTSSLASGIEVDGVTVYNFWGINAVDTDPLGGGSSKASELGWDSVEGAIKGGATWIAKNYLHAGQRTAYAMKYNHACEWHGYATDVAWADKVASYIYELYFCYSEDVESFEFEKVVYVN